MPGVQTIDRFIGTGNPLAAAGGGAMLLRATGGNYAGAALLAAIARKESSFGKAAFAPNNYWGYGIHEGPSVNTAPTVEAMAHRVWQGLNGHFYRGAGKVTAHDILYTYAPPSDGNDTALYDSQVNGWLRSQGVNPNVNVFAGGGARGGPSAAGAPRGTREAPGAASPAGGGQLSAAGLRMVQEYAARTRAQVLAGQMPEDAAPVIQRLSFEAGGGAPAAAAAPRGPGGGAPAPSFGNGRGDGYLGINAKIIGTPGAGTHTLGDWESDNAIDLAAPVGTPVYAIQGGTIGSQFGSLGSGGRFAGLRLHLNTGGNEFYYAHLSRFAPGIRPGVRVAPGQLLGYSGEANGVGHLHLGVEHGDPRRLLR